MIVKIKHINNTSEFAQTLLRWNKLDNSRQMPWKGEKDPYKVWLSEIILQQTRVEQGLAYYNAFIKKFSNIKKLAAAPDDTVFKLWEGLGYYSRCRNLLATARYISKEKDGVFPNTYEEIVQLKGVGPYTAAAIASFVYNLPYAVVDGNVFRVLSRVFGIDTPIDTTAGKKYFTQLANQLLPVKQAGIYNQALMDFGAVVCKPAAPLCETCPFNTSCIALKNKVVNLLPVKEKKLLQKKRFFYFMALQQEGKTYIEQRTGKDIWKDLYQYPLVETPEAQPVATVIKTAKAAGIIPAGAQLIHASGPVKQQLTHQQVHGMLVWVKVPAGYKAPATYIAVTPQKVQQYAFPKLIHLLWQQDTN